jgi:CRP-like cAMP-binding protein
VDKFKQFLENIAPVNDKEFSDIISHFAELNLKKGDYFVKQNKICRHIGFVIKGALRTYYISDKAEEITSCFCSENNFSTSYKSFIQQVPSKLSIQAIEETHLLVIGYDYLQKLYTKSRAWQTIGRAIVEREYITLEQYASMLNNESAKEKYLRLLKEQPNIIHKANIEDIASFLGVTRRTLSRIRKEITNSF